MGSINREESWSRHKWEILLQKITKAKGLVMRLK
jgi:hypothetical protein